MSSAKPTSYCNFLGFVANPRADWLFRRYHPRLGRRYSPASPPPMRHVQQRAVTFMDIPWLTTRSAHGIFRHFGQHPALDLAHCYFEPKLDQSRTIPL